MENDKNTYIKLTHKFLLSTPYFVKAITDTARLSKLLTNNDRGGQYCNTATIVYQIVQ